MPDSNPPSPSENGEKDPPGHLPEEGILLGYSLEHERHTAPIGFTYGTSADPSRDTAGKTPTLDAILHTGGGHLMTIAPTGGGKGVGCIVPSLLRYPGPVIVVDPKGENYAVTAARRRELGEQVVVLDPLGITSAPESGALNPLDLIDPSSPQSIDDAAALASLLSGGVEKDDPRNMFWYQRGAQLLTGLIQFVAVDRPAEARNLSEVRRLLNLPTEDFTALASAQMANSSDPDVRQVAGSLANPASEMIGSILGMAQNSLGFLRGPLLADATSSSTLDLEAITAGDPISVFIVIPPDKLESHRNLLRVWIGVLMGALMRRRAPVPRPTLLVLDEAAQLGPLEQLRQAITLMRGYGLQTWSFWQDVSQLENLYPRDWETMYNNCRVHQAFGFTTLKAAEVTCDLLGFHDPLEALQMDSDEMILSVSGDQAVIAQKPNYLTDPAFDGLFAPNPFYSKSADVPPAPRRRKRLYIRPTMPRRGDRHGVDEVFQEGPPPEAESDDDDRLMDLDELFESVGMVAEEDPEDSVTGSSVLDPLPDVAIEWPAGVNQFLTLIVDKLGGSWNPVTAQIRGVSPVFYPKCHIVEVIDPSHDPPRQVILKTETDLRIFRGRGRDFDRLNREVPAEFIDETVGEYVRLRFHFQRGTRRIRIVDTMDRLRFYTGRPDDELTELESLIEPLQSFEDAPNGWTVTGTAISEGALVRIRLAVGFDGSIERIEREAIAPLDESSNYPAVDLEGEPAAPELSRELEELHGRWEALEGPDRDDVLSDFTEYSRDLAGEDGTVLRRTLSCYPDWDLVRIANREYPTRQFFFHQGGKSVQSVTGSSQWLYDIFHGIYEEFPHIDTPEQAQDYLRFFTWIISSPESYWLVLDRADHLPLSHEFAIAPHAREELQAQWTPLSEVPLLEDDGDSVLRRFKGTVLHGQRVVRAEFKIEAGGKVEMSESDDLQVGLILDEHRLERILALPLLGRGI